ncbi:hypothetical protein PAXRUDRAFT_160511 [Paxillus rubicundulus Ve08.2h10]|uniref:Uncharacterized protein n=1 Tax=Paxillus rubicundulus Ve08.2h10 TaxID=930991 RepID=A0A0D0DML9_9AGAM|nr:hypothetical protein PAXRUDRAFT_160511 [Paxillus rubicundulus Ve08.2h10]
MSNQSHLIQIYVASESRRSSFALVDPTSAFNCMVRELICLSAVTLPLLGGHALLPTVSVKLTEEWRSEWEMWMVSETVCTRGGSGQGGLLRALQDAKDQGESLVIPYDVVQAIAMAEVAYTNLEGQAEAERARGIWGGRTGVEVEEGGSRASRKRKHGGDRHA